MKIKTLENEIIGPCWVCGKTWKRKETDKYFYFNGMFVCQVHNGAHSWYHSTIKLSLEKEIIEMEVKSNED